MEIIDILILSFFLVCVCVLPLGRSILKVSFPWLSSLQIGKSCHSWFCLVFSFWVYQEASFLPLFPRSQEEKDRRSAMCVPAKLFVYFLIVNIVDFSLSTRRSTSSLVTLFDREMFRIFLQSHISQLSSLTFV